MINVRLVFVAVLACFAASSASAQVIFHDEFDGAPSPAWGNERGGWYVHDGVYDAAAPTNSPPTLSTLPFELGDASIDVDVLGVVDGGIWVHTTDVGDQGVLLVTGGSNHTFNGLYWHVIHNGQFSGQMGMVGNLFTPGTNIHVHVDVHGSVYSAFINGSNTPATTIDTGEVITGRFGLYDYTAGNQEFDNVVVNSACPVDFNSDGFVDFFDFNAFVTCFEGGDCPLGRSADFNGDDFVDFFDFNDFVDAFEAGC